MMRPDQRIQIPDHKFLASRKIVAQQILDYSVHHLRTNDVADQRHQQQQEREEGQNEVGSDGKRKGVHIGPEQIARGGAQDAFGWSGTMLGCTFLVGKLDGRDRRHWFLNIIKYLRVAVEALRARVSRAWRWIGSGVKFASVRLPTNGQQFRSCQSESSCYYLLLRQSDTVGE